MLRSAILLTACASAYAYDIQSLFGPHLSTGAKIYYPNDSNWTTDVQQRWTTWYAPQYRGAIKVATVQDVQTVVEIASANSIPFMATAAGHGASQTYGKLQNGLDIDISNFNSASYNNKSGLLEIGGAATFQTIWDTLQPYGKEIPTGSAQCVGALGAALGAGIGALQGHRGLMLDVLHSVELVTANGTLLHVSQRSNPELFWGIKGAGFNFGIVVSAKFRVFDATYGGSVMEGDMAFPASINESFWEVVKTFDSDGKLDPKLSLVSVLSFSPKTNSTSIVLNINYFGSNETLQRYMKPFLNLQPAAVRFTLVPWNKLYTALFFGADGSACSKNLRLNSGGSAVLHTDVPTWVKYTNDFDQFSRTHPSVSAAFVASRFSSRTPLSVPDWTAAYPYRNINTHLYWEQYYPQQDDYLDQVTEDFFVQSRALFQPTSGYLNDTVYVNYANGDEGPEVWYTPAKLPRLAALKRRYDPKEQFSYNSPVPLYYP